MRAVGAEGYRGQREIYIYVVYPTWCINCSTIFLNVLRATYYAIPIARRVLDENLFTQHTLRLRLREQGYTVGH